MLQLLVRGLALDMAGEDRRLYSCLMVVFQILTVFSTCDLSIIVKSALWK